MNEIKGDIPQYIKQPDVTPDIPEKKDFISRIKKQLNDLMGEIKGGKSSPQTNVVENPPVSATERTVPKEGNITEGAVLGKPQGYSEPQTNVVENPPVSATERTVPASGETTSQATLPSAPTGLSAGGAPAPTVAPPPPAPQL